MERNTIDFECVPENSETKPEEPPLMEYVSRIHGSHQFRPAFEAVLKELLRVGEQDVPVLHRFISPTGPHDARRVTVPYAPNSNDPTVTQGYHTLRGLYCSFKDWLIPRPTRCSLELHLVSLTQLHVQNPVCVHGGY